MSPPSLHMSCSLYSPSYIKASLFLIWLYIYVIKYQQLKTRKKVIIIQQYKLECWMKFKSTVKLILLYLCYVTKCRVGWNNNISIHNFVGDLFLLPFCLFLIGLVGYMYVLYIIWDLDLPYIAGSVLVNMTWRMEIKGSIVGLFQVILCRVICWPPLCCCELLYELLFVLSLSRYIILLLLRWTSCCVYNELRPPFVPWCGCSCIGSLLIMGQSNRIFCYDDPIFPLFFFAVFDVRIHFLFCSYNWEIDAAFS